MKKVLIFLFVFGLTSIGIEFFLKLTRITPPTLKYYNPVYGSLNRPNISYFKSTEGLYIGNTNYDGRFRENYPKRKADKKTLRILLIGDSFVEGIDVFSSNHFANFVEELLGKKLGRKVEVLDFGRGNCTIQASSYYFNDYIAKEYDGDIVLYFTEGRDIYRAGPKGYPSTSYQIDSNENLFVGYGWKQSWEYLFHKRLSSYAVLKHYDNSAYFRLFYRAFARIKLNGIPLLTFGKFVGQPLEQDYTGGDNADSLSSFTAKVYDTVYKYNAGQVVYVVRNKPVNAPCIINYMDQKSYNYINLSDTFTDFNIKNTKINAYYFKATNAYGGHWNNDGHRAVGIYLANKIYRSLGNYKMPNYER